MRLLALLGDSPSSRCAQQLACALARLLDADLAGLGGIDLEAVEVRLPSGIGGSAYQTKIEEHRRARAANKMAQIRETYEQQCRDCAVPFESLAFEGNPLKALHSASEERDLLITGHDTAFSGDAQDGISPLIAKLLLLSPRPIIVCGNEIRRSNSILIAYDGSIPAIRALQLFTLLGLATKHRVQVITINPDEEICAQRAHSAVNYLRGHGVTAETIPVVTTVDPAEILRMKTAEHATGMIVMGAYGHTGWRELLFGSTTTNLVERPPCPLFLFH